MALARGAQVPEMRGFVIALGAVAAVVAQASGYVGAA